MATEQSQALKRRWERLEKGLLFSSNLDSSCKNLTEKMKMLSDKEGTTVWLSSHKNQPWLTRGRGQVGGCWALGETLSSTEQALAIRQGHTYQ